MFQQLNFRVDYNTADYSELEFSQADREILASLGKQVAEIASRPVMGDRKNLWKKHNRLGKTRPVILCDPENGWNEIIPESVIGCTGSIARCWEDSLRKQVFWGNEMNDDYVVEAVFHVPFVWHEKQWSVSGSHVAATEKTTAEQGKAYHINTILEEYEQIDRIRKPELNIDYKASDAVLEIAHEIFDGILEVNRATVWFWSFGLTDDFVFLRGMEKFMMDFYDAPEKVHEVMKIIFDGTMERLDFLETNGLLCLNNDGTFTGSGGMGFSDELPSPGYNGKVRTKDMWGLAESQVTIGISPDMFGEFIFPYQKNIMARFGLTCYGCCEPMDDRFDIVREAKNLRRVSVSPWADRRIMSEKLGHEYIYSLKAPPSYLAVPQMDEDLVRKDIREALDIARNNCLEIVMKDNHTLGNNPGNLKNWVKIVRKEIGAD